jgi:O-acetyl-ADP-ribose deacetylase
MPNEKILLNGRLIVETGDLTQKRADAIVNAANSSLLGGGGVDGAIHRQGGPKILDECRAIRERDYPDGLPAGKAVCTTGGDLPARYVIHTVGPVWKGGESGEPGVLSSAYRNSLAIASKLNLESIAFPAISTGVYGYPRDKAAAVAFAAIKKYLSANQKPETVYLVFYSEGDAAAFLAGAGQDR